MNIIVILVITIPLLITIAPILIWIISYIIELVKIPLKIYYKSKKPWEIVSKEMELKRTQTKISAKRLIWVTLKTRLEACNAKTINEMRRQKLIDSEEAHEMILKYTDEYIKFIDTEYEMNLLIKKRDKDIEMLNELYNKYNTKKMVRNYYYKESIQSIIPTSKR